MYPETVPSLLLLLLLYGAGSSVSMVLALGSTTQPASVPVSDCRLCAITGGECVHHYDNDQFRNRIETKKYKQIRCRRKIRTQAGNVMYWDKIQSVFMKQYDDVFSTKGQQLNAFLEYTCSIESWKWHWQIDGLTFSIGSIKFDSYFEELHSLRPIFWNWSNPFGLRITGLINIYNWTYYI